MTAAATNNLWETEKGSQQNDSKPQLRVGLIGCGAISGIHLDGWKRLNPGCKIVACADPVEERRNQRGDQADVPPECRFPYIDDLLAAGVQLDAVDICTTNKFHGPIAIQALNAGIHVLCEKPLALNPDEVRSMIAARDRSGKILMTAQQLRFQSESVHLKNYLKTGALGEIYYARAHYMRRRYLPPRPGFLDKAVSGGGPTIDIGVHILDLALHLMDHPEPKSVTAVTLQKLAKRKDIKGWWGEWDRDAINVEDFAAGFIRFTNGAALSLECSWLANIKEPEYQKITLLGTDAGAEWPELTIHSELAGSITDTVLRFADDKVGGHQKEIAAFADAVLTGKPSPVPTEQSLNVIRILDGLYRSSEAGQEVSV